MTADDGMYISWMPTQQIYIDSLTKKFFVGDPTIRITSDYIPPFVDIEMRFTTFDPTNEEATRWEDYFTIRVYSNNETLSDSCETEFSNNLYIE
jgi:hypothetical protein